MDGDPLEQAWRFLVDHHQAVLITRRRSGALQSSPVAAAVDEEGRVLVSTRRQSAKAANAGRDARVSMCVVSPEWFGPWVHLDGTAEVVTLPRAMDLLIDYYQRVAGEHPDWEDYRRAMETEERVILRITPTSATVSPRR